MRSAMKYNSAGDRYPLKDLQDYSIKKHLKKNCRLEQTITVHLLWHYIIMWIKLTDQLAHELTEV